MSTTTTQEPVKVGDVLYRSRAEIIYKNHRNKLLSKLSELFRSGRIPEHITLDQLTEVACILGIEPTENAT